MSQQLISLGTVANDGTGDSARSGGAKINSNFTELYGQTVTVRVTTQTASYILAAADAHGVVRMDVVGPNNLTVPPDADVTFGTPTAIVIRQAGAGQTTIVAGSSVIINKAASKTLKLAEQGASATLIKVGTNEWDLEGNLELAP